MTAVDVPRHARQGASPWGFGEGEGEGDRTTRLQRETDTLGGRLGCGLKKKMVVVVAGGTGRNKQSAAKGRMRKKGKAEDFIPYRDSVSVCAKLYGTALKEIY